MKRRQFIASGVGMSVVNVASLNPAWAQSAASGFPTKPLRFVVPFAAGGATDAMARMIGERLGKVLGQTVVVENKTGASGAIGANDVAKSAADGHTLLFTISDPLISNTVLVKNLSYDPQKDFRFVASILKSPALLSVPSALGVKNFDEFKKFAAASKSPVTYASWGIGSIGHLAGESLGKELKFESIHVAQRGEAPVLQDLLSQTVNSGFTSAGTAKQHVVSGKLTPIAMMGPNRSSSLPDVPTFKELGIRDPFFDLSVWMSFSVPSKTPDAIVARLTREIEVIGNSSDVTNAIKERGLEPMVAGPGPTQILYNSEFPIITKRLRDLNIEPS